jgi:hypothetical protein
MVTSFMGYDAEQLIFLLVQKTTQGQAFGEGHLGGVFL